ncbi:4-hydroxythreonine-4-phosphate dehydrogenase PdxA [bacterium]|nr:4-hydroxythreonine-4-phosphate dehydrogenase PdxA [bacterium]
MSHLKPIFINCGDPNGIGPEVTLKALINLDQTQRQRLILAGSLQQLMQINKQLGEPLQFIEVKSIDGLCVSESIPVIVPPAVKSSEINYGSVSEFGGAVSGQGIGIGVKACLQGSALALVTAPSSKEALHLAGYRFPGQTEMITKLAGVDRSIMILAAGQLRVGMATTHIPLHTIATVLTKDVIVEKLQVLHQTLMQWFRVINPRIGVAALNPHASDGGIFGNEEKLVIEPAIEIARVDGLNVTGPFPADTLFPRYQQFDGILAMYHDQGMIPVKMAGFGKAVNLTGGLPFPRTSPDHGTAFDIAGKMRADAGSMLEAILTAMRTVDNVES